jgi:hypothetical protein
MLRQLVLTFYKKRRSRNKMKINTRLDHKAGTDPGKWQNQNRNASKSKENKVGI